MVAHFWPPHGVGSVAGLHVNERMRAVIPASIALGIAWNVVAVSLMGGRIVDAFAPSWLLAGALAGVAAGFTFEPRPNLEASLQSSGVFR